jgi:alkanesulfonate monooxygenase SsuD/methylene tetrahydromethanopterin reductase-like flavin-dependent oxidoreductase (luciferase family)
VGRTEAEAKEKYEEMQSLVDPVIGLSQLAAMFPGVDLSGYPLDGPLPELPETNAIKSRQDALVSLARRDNLSIRQLYLHVAGARSHWVVVGSAEQIADQLEHRFLNGAADGYNIMPPTLPGGLNDFVDLVVPELQRRGLYRTSYEGRTLRENLGVSRPPHPAARFSESKSA